MITETVFRKIALSAPEVKVQVAHGCPPWRGPQMNVLHRRLFVQHICCCAFS